MKFPAEKDNAYITVAQKSVEIDEFGGKVQ
jgi:hypothetical protein